MPLHILILESNSPDMVDAARANGAPTGAERYARALRALVPDLRCTIAEPYRVPFDEGMLGDADGVVFTGAGVSWATDAAEAAPLRRAGEAVFARSLPSVGSCNGLQLATVLLGGSVGASKKGMEVGLATNITLTEAGRHHPFMKNRESGFAVPCIHRDIVIKLPDGAVILAANAHCDVQAMAYFGNGVDFWGVQYHPEYSASVIAGFLKGGRSIFSEHAALAQQLEKADTNKTVAAELGASDEDLNETRRTTELANWLAHVRDVRS